ncbi:tetratricopeptide repeat protein [Duganella sp. FT94W]|uniref:Tetratricopeptide repeat protein n=1 Tax=Duganella lactea TaxID=2692173 RepID=A0ABW9V2Y0_9BURK|nr:tetratricopeptide repeat protein [Duganella lactea]MYM34049.1 tetratricopeptide repeat protein [Duganella lactea]
MSLTFEILDSESGVFTYSGEAYDGLLDEFDGLLDGHASGEIGATAYLAALDGLSAKAPDFVDVYAHVGLHWQQQGKHKKALDAALQGLSAANRLIPEAFNGQIKWAHIGNRPYLRAMHIVAISYARLQRHKDAVTLIGLMLERNPNDNQGVRYLLGSEALRAGNHKRAQEVFEQEASSYPLYFYELGLSHILRDDWTTAATALRRGFIANPYIAEILAGNPNPEPLAIWHGTNFAEPELARQYIEHYGLLWQRKPEYAAFVRWLFNHSKVMAERAAVLECQESFLWESDGVKREELYKRAEDLAGKIDDALSAEIVTKRQNRRSGGAIWPWMLHQLRLPA